MVIASRRGHLLLGGAALVVALLPLVAGAYVLQLVSTALVMALFALSLQLLVGGTGLVSLGQAGFFGLGAYAVYFVQGKGAAASLLLTLPVAALLAGLAALAVGALALRTRGFFFLMTTLAFGQMLYFLIHDAPWAGGADGIFVQRPNFGLFGLDYVPARRDRPAVLLWTNLALLCAAYAGLVVVMRSLFGRMLQGIKENDHRMQALGHNTYAVKLVAFVLAGALAGVAGHQWAMTEAFVNPELLGWHRSAEALLMVLLGGLGALHGPLLGAFAFIGLNELAQLVTERQRLVEGLVILAAELLLRDGLAGLRWRSRA